MTGGQAIPSSGGAAVADTTCSNAAVVCTDLGNVGRNVLRGPRQTNVDFSVIKRFPFGESKNLEFRAEFFNLFNQVNFANPISNLNAIPATSFNPTGQIINPGDFGRIISTSNNPRIIQFAVSSISEGEFCYAAGQRSFWLAAGRFIRCMQARYSRLTSLPPPLTSGRERLTARSVGDTRSS